MKKRQMWHAVGTCVVCGKKSFESRKSCRAAMRRYHPNGGMSVYKCGDYWHYGHQSYAVHRSMKAREEFGKLRMWAESIWAVEEISSQFRFWAEQRGIDPSWVPVDGYVEKIDDNRIRIELFSTGPNDRPIMAWTPQGQLRPRVVWSELESAMPPAHFLQEPK